MKPPDGTGKKEEGERKSRVWGEEIKIVGRRTGEMNRIGDWGKKIGGRRHRGERGRG